MQSPVLSILSMIAAPPSRNFAPASSASARPTKSAACAAQDDRGDIIGREGGSLAKNATGLPMEALAEHFRAFA